MIKDCRFLFFIFIMLLTSCVPVTRAPESTPTWTAIPLTPTPLPTETITPTATETPLPSFPLDGYVLVFRRDGDLYFQDGSNPPVRLTQIGERAPGIALSDDHQKIAFFRQGDSSIYVINTDGTEEQILVPGDWLANLEPGTQAATPTFIPATHQALFTTFECKWEWDTYCLPSPIGLFLTDADTGKITEILPSGEVGQYDPSDSFKVSPDGKMIAVGTVGRVDIIDMTGSVLRKDVLPFTPSLPSDNSFSQFPQMFWLPDSSGLILAIPDAVIETNHFGDFSAYTLYRYLIKNSAVIKLPLDPTPLSIRTGKPVVSPDGNWIVFSAERDKWISYYLGDLVHGKTSHLDWSSFPQVFWNSDSEYFIYRAESGNKLCSVDGPQNPIITNIIFLDWIDSAHFTYWIFSENVHIEDAHILIGEIGDENVVSYDLGLHLDDLLVINRK